MPASPAKDIQAVYHITHMDNVRDILCDGVWSHNKADAREMPPVVVYDEKIVAQRKLRKIGDKPLSEFANFYFQPRNAMLYRLCQEKRDVVVLRLRRDAMELPGAHISVGNAAAAASVFYPAAMGMRELLKRTVWGKINAEYWNNTDDGKRLMMSELLVPDSAPPELIDSIYVLSEKNKAAVEKMGVNIPVLCEPNMFFQPTYKNKIADNLSLVEGDMFFSSMHTFTISVNIKGVMGKGLASRAKYQFPDVYVKYQDACRSKRLTPETPFLYKRESSLDVELSYAPETLQNPNASRWFLLFATKRDWRDDSLMEDIEAGMRWIEKNYEREGIKSLALPALGCGLGGLKWAEVGPLMCQTLARMSIQSVIYLPREAATFDAQKSADFLLRKKG